MPDRPVRIAAVPAQHPYVQAVRVPGDVVLADPPVPGAPPTQWWPPQVLTPAWLRAHATEYDLLHVHFGTESLSLDALAAALSSLRELGRPLVHTVHDLEHPHLVDQAPHRAHLELLMREAAELLTLTEEAAAEIARRYGREATVVPHPQMAPDAWFARADAAREDAAASRSRPSSPPDATAEDPSPRGPVVGVHLRSLRANVRPGAWLARLAAETAARDGALRVLVNDDVRAGTPADEALGDLRRALEPHGAHLVVRPRPDDDGLARELVGLDVSVLPYAHGTHSGWLELCWDLGVPVLSPAVGAIAGQHREGWALATFDAARPAAVGAALDRLLAAPPAPPAAERLAERERIAAANHRAHTAVYWRALGHGD
ncbi:glycosyltransferase [Patulibacter americanus]|uniref:glycosyltransferase n=1 Tax=Patulibacter americanus TaxID=588672 RepID=UPI0003B56EF4|nr:glycosyltransferase [Patulibacter americanus]